MSWYEPTAWYWEFGDGATSTERNPTHIFPAPGAYDVCLTVSNANGADTKCKTVWVSTVSTGEPGKSAGDFVLYPNPTTGAVRWDVPGAVTVRVFHAIGKEILRRTTADQQIDLAGLPSGTYFLQAQWPNGRVAVRPVLLIRQ